jgi:hypothetical protein
LTENNNTYLKSYGTRSGVTTWSINGQVSSTLSFVLTYNEYETYIVFDYRCNGEVINYKVNLISKPSNLGRGEVWFFVCPVTRKCCRKLYLYGTHFLHREAHKGFFYESQTKSQSTRNMLKMFDAVFINDAVYDELYKKYFKTHYNGKETKRYKRITAKINKAESFPRNTIESFLMK